MPFEVVMTEAAARDLDQSYDYIAEHDSPSKTDAVLGRIENAMENLQRIPERGAYPKELLALAMREYRETFFKPYRVIYRIVDRTVVIFIITDGRQDMQSLLSRRLLGG